MTEPKGKPWRTAIAGPEDERIVVRGYDLNELIGRLTFSEMLYLIQRGELPSRQQARVIDAVLVAVADHGISPSSTVTRFLSASGVPVQVAVAGGLMTFGDIHGGASEACAKLLQVEVARARAEGIPLAKAAEDVVASARAARRPLDGFGHPQHRGGRPRRISEAPSGLARKSDTAENPDQYRRGCSVDHLGPRFRRPVRSPIHDHGPSRRPLRPCTGRD